MITVTNRDTCKPAYIDADNILYVEELQDEIDGKLYPFSRVFLKDEKEEHEYSLDVIESKAKIENLAKEKTENRWTPKIYKWISKNDFANAGTLDL